MVDIFSSSFAFLFKTDSIYGAQSFSTYLGKFPRQALIVTQFKSLLFKKFEVKPEQQQSIPLWTSAILRSDILYPAPPLVVHSSPTSKKLPGPVLEIVQIVSAPTSVTQSPSFLPAESQLKELQQDVSEMFFWLGYLQLAHGKCLSRIVLNSKQTVWLVPTLRLEIVQTEHSLINVQEQILPQCFLAVMINPLTGGLFLHHHFG